MILQENQKFVFSLVIVEYVISKLHFLNHFRPYCSVDLQHMSIKLYFFKTPLQWVYYFAQKFGSSIQYGMTKSGQSDEFS